VKQKPDLPDACLEDPPGRPGCERSCCLFDAGVQPKDSTDATSLRDQAVHPPMLHNANHVTMPAEIRPYWHAVLTIFKLVTFIRKSSSGCPIDVVLFFSLLAVTAPVTVTVWFMCFARSTVELLSP